MNGLIEICVCDKDDKALLEYEAYCVPRKGDLFSIISEQEGNKQGEITDIVWNVSGGKLTGVVVYLENIRY